LLREEESCPQFLNCSTPRWFYLERTSRDAFEFIGPVTGQKVLELGFHDGQIACAFASLGAHVTGLEVFSRHVRAAQKRAEILAVSKQTDFRTYDGNVATVSGEFDVVFTKSVLVTTDVPVMLPAIRGKLRPGDRFAFIENAYGGPFRQLLRSARGLRHRIAACITSLPRVST
jgi:2-polyprenyl-3-methyl-5-hydroxy-6-metoxy-1,4-benzoquinol methylase